MIGAYLEWSVSQSGYLQTTLASPMFNYTFHDSDGMGRTGTFITIHAMMERLRTEHVVDFFQFIKSSRARRQNFVMTLVRDHQRTAYGTFG